MASPDFLPVLTPFDVEHAAQVSQSGIDHPLTTRLIACLS
jgi:hypothetical protein